MSEYIISKTEIKRRKKAFATLLLSLLIGIVLFSNILVFSISPIGYISIIIVFFVLCIITFQFLSSLSQIKIRITDQEIERQKGKNIEKYQISEINSLKIKRRTNGIIREIYISLNNRKYLYISAIEEQFELLKDALVNKTNKKIRIKEIREPLNFDHFLFYPILGLLISSGGIFFLKQILSFDYSIVRIISLFFSVYILCLAVYFIIKKPISVGSGKDKVTIDYVFGFGMLITSILMAILGLQ